MPTADFFSRLGLFVVRDFFDDATCSRLRAAVRAGEETRATVYDGSEARKLAPETRRTVRAHVAADVLTFVTDRINAARPAIAEHFGTTLTACQEPTFLVYRAGDFFAAHADAGDDPDEPPGIRARKVSVVIFLSGESARADEQSYTGGSLVFYDLLTSSQLGSRGLPLIGEPGLLVAFRPELVHRVNAVGSGERQTIVTWFV